MCLYAIIEVECVYMVLKVCKKSIVKITNLTNMSVCHQRMKGSDMSAGQNNWIFF